jgi:transposase
MYKERDIKLRAEYLERLEDISSARLVYVDESGVDHNIIKERCWTKKGEEITGERSGKFRERTSVIAALNQDEVMAPMRFQGTANTELFLYWIEYFLIPVLTSRQVVIMDNASIHKSPKVKELIEKAGCYLIYLPPYSPDLSPIENYWAVMKKHIRKIRHKFDYIVDAIDQALINEKRYFLPRDKAIS